MGTVCVDKYEASVWQIPAGNATLVRRVRGGRAALDDLLAGGAVQVSATSPTQVCGGIPFPSGFPPTGAWTEPLYAASVAGVLPSACLTWFQAQQACALSGKRLLTNEEWQRAAAGTPDDLTDTLPTSRCNISLNPGPTATGSRPACVSSWGAYDMVGNLYEFVADWAERATACTDWGANFGWDTACFGGNATGRLPGAMLRGGYWGLSASGLAGGVFAISTINAPSFGVEGIGFRCGR